MVLTSEGTVRLTIALLLILACAAPVQAEPASASPTPADPAAAPLTLEELFRRPKYRSYTLSPDGRFMVEIFQAETPPAPKDRTDRQEWLRWYSSPLQEIWLTDLTTRQYQRVVAGVRGVRVSRVRWIDGRNFLWHVYRNDSWSIERVSINIKDDGTSELGEVMNLGNGFLLGLVPGTPLRMLVSGPDEGAISVFRVDPTQLLRPQMVASNRVAGPYEGLSEAAYDSTGTLRVLTMWRRFGDKRVLFRAALDQPWKPVFTAAQDPWRTLELVGFDDRNGMIQVVTDIESDRRVLRELDPRTGRLGRILHDDGRNDVTGAVSLDTTGRVTSVLINDNDARVVHLDPVLERMQSTVQKRIPGYTPRLLTVAADRSRAVIFTGESDNPGKYSLYDARDDKLFLMEHAMPWLKGRSLARSEPFSMKARDGLTIHGQFTPPQPAVAAPPVIVLPHGGPFGVRDYALYDAEVQYLASRGYAVLQVDFRGSGGYGRDFLKAGFGRWGGEMQDDLADALRWLIGTGKVDGARACIYGGSYGGYAAVMGLIRYPELFRCGATMAGVSDLSLLHSSTEFRNDPWVANLLREIIGDPVKEKERLQRSSPAFLARQIKRPLLIAHGAKDERADPEHAWRLRAAVEAAGGKPVWMMFEEEGHGLVDPENREAFYTRLVAFFDEHLRK
jgi:dipeptidyl aminopeptidase/acylaminoacyl peptidase